MKNHGPLAAILLGLACASAGLCSLAAQQGEEKAGKDAFFPDFSPANCGTCLHHHLNGGSAAGRGSVVFFPDERLGYDYRILAKDSSATNVVTGLKEFGRFDTKALEHHYRRRHHAT